MALGNIALRGKEIRSRDSELAGFLTKWIEGRRPRRSSSGSRGVPAVGKIPAAIEELQKAREIAPNNPLVLNNLALVLQVSGQPQSEGRV